MPTVGSSVAPSPSGGSNPRADKRFLALSPALRRLIGTTERLARVPGTLWTLVCQVADGRHGDTHNWPTPSQCISVSAVHTAARGRRPVRALPVAWGRGRKESSPGALAAAPGVRTVYRIRATLAHRLA